MGSELNIDMRLRELRREVEQAQSRPKKSFRPKEVVLELLEIALETGIRGSNREALDAVRAQIRGTRELTDLEYQRAPGTVKDSTRHGFLLLPETGGRRRWIYRYVPKGQKSARELTLGYSPEMTLSEARSRWEIGYLAHKRGECPKRALAKTDGQGELTVAQLVRKYLAEYALVHTGARTYRDYDAILHRELVPDYGHLPAVKLEQEQVRTILLNICQRAKLQKGRSGIRSAQKALQAISAMFNVATGRSKKFGNLQPWLPTGHLNPTDGVNPGMEDARVADMTRDELALFLKHLPDSGINQTAQDAIWMVLYSFGRISEVCQMRWEQINWKDGVWELPRAESKNALSKKVMLAPQMVRLLERRRQVAPDRSPWVFPAERDITRVLTVDRLGHLVRENRQALGLAEGREVTPYWLRHRATTWAKEEGASLDVRDRLTNHKPKGVDGIYTQTADMDRQALEWSRKWADYLDSVLVADPAVGKGNGESFE